ncbi:MAG: 16S rRNA (cytidine(1402)-2'-O)-methyltransferase [Rhodospirillales bacterium]|nr:16S rRNA (cytidine(1402)-2'-O)-methyltransferase [Rhodospirillales bacterium]
MAGRKNDFGKGDVRSSGDAQPSSVTNLGSEPSGGGRQSKRLDWTPVGLCLVATPIGNAADISLRALRALETADAVACEDSRVTGRLLALHGIKNSLTPYHEHNAAKVRPVLMKRLKNGESVALVSDAGTPLISDPGYRLVTECIEAGIPVSAVPGASSVLTALQLSGLPTDRFFFAGFLSPKTAARKKALSEVAEIPGSLIFLESPKRLAATLADMAEILGPRSAAVTRELTKLFEEVRRGSLPDLARDYAEQGPPKGEVTLVVGPPAEAAEIDDGELDDRLREALADNSLRDAAALVSAATGLPRKRVYARALALSKKP